MDRVIGILAHVDAGKTTFSEQLLYHAGVLRAPGRVDHGDAFLDAHPLERQRGITIFSDQAVFERGEDRFFWVDTPGHADFAAEMERALSVLDYAVLVVNGAEGIQSHTETLWTLLEAYHVPALIFINKTDRPACDADEVLSAVKRRLSADATDMDGWTGGDCPRRCGRPWPSGTRLCWTAGWRTATIRCCGWTACGRRSGGGRCSRCTGGRR